MTHIVIATNRLFDHSAVLSLTFVSTECTFPALVTVAFVLITASARMLRKYELAVVFTIGCFQAVKESGLMLLVPFI